MKGLKVTATIVLLAAAGGALAYWRTQAPVSVRVAAPERDVEIRVFGIGTIEAQISAKIGFQVPGRLIALEADQGDLLAPGAILARLDGAVQQARVQKAHVALEQSETTLAKANALLSRAQINAQQRQAIAERRQTLIERGAVSREAADDAIAAAAIARADVAVAETEVKVATAARKDFGATAAIEQSVLDQHVLVAPFRSRIIARLKEVGSTVNATEPVYFLINPETIWVRAFVDESLAGALAVGQTAWVRLRSNPHEAVEAEIVRIDEENDRVTEERRIYVRCRACQPGHLVRHLGEQAEVEVITRKVDQGLFAPLFALDAYDGRSGLAWTLEDGKLARRALSLADRTLDGRALIVSGLPQGARLVVARERSAFRTGRAAVVESGPDR